MKIFEIAGEGKLHGLTVMSLDAFVGKEDDVEESDMSGLMHAAKNYNKSFLITAELAEGGKKTFRVRAQSDQTAREKFAQHHNQATIISVKEEGVAEGFGEYVPLAIFLGMIYTWYKNTKTKEPSFKVFINGKDVSNKVLTKAEAVHVIKNLAKQEHNTKTQYTIVDIKTNNIVFRRTWSDNLDLTGISPSWVDSNESVNQGVAEGDVVRYTNRHGTSQVGIFSPNPREAKQALSRLNSLLKVRLFPEGDRLVDLGLVVQDEKLFSLIGYVEENFPERTDLRDFTPFRQRINKLISMAQQKLAPGVAEASKELPQWKKDWYAKQKPNSWPKHPQPYHDPDWVDKLSPEEREKLITGGLKESNSPVIANTADRLSNKDDGRIAKLRAAGDARREQHLKGRDIAKNDRTSKDAWGDLKEAPGDFGLGANYRAVPDDEMQDLMGRSKNKTKTKRDKFDYPYIHGSNIEVKDEAGKKFDTEKLRAAIMTRPASILGQNAKMQHSETGDEAIFDIGLPALKGLAVNEKTGEFVVVDTCPGAGACQTYCYAMKGSYVMFKAVSMGLARMLNFLLNDPEGFAAKLNQEIAAAKAKYAKKGARIVVRWHDAGDFFSPEYLDMAYKVAEANPDVGFYAYTKMGDVANAARPSNFNMNFSQGAKTGQEKKVNITRTKHSKVVPKDMFFDLIARKGNELIKDAKGRMQFASPENLDKFKTTMAQKYAIDKNSILTYDQMMKTPVGEEPKWNVIVMPGDGDNSANRNDVVGSYLLFH